MTDWKKYLKQRVIIEDAFHSQFLSNRALLEAKVMEISREGRVKLKLESGFSGWYPANEFVVVEVLK